MENYNYKNLNQLIGEKVQLKDDQGNQTELTISEVNTASMDGDDWEAFSVIYQGQKDSTISQGNYTLTHKSFGEKQLFLSPNSETEYETVVTRKRAEPK